MWIAAQRRTIPVGAVAVHVDPIFWAITIVAKVRSCAEGMTDSFDIASDGGPRV